MEALEAAGFGSPRAIAEAGREALAALPIITDRADKIHTAAEEWLAARAQPEAEPEPVPQVRDDAAPPPDAAPPTAGT